MLFRSNILTKLKQRQKDAFEQIYKEYYKLVYYVALNITKDEDMAQDVMQDTFVKFMNQIDHYTEEGRIKQYITTIAKNLAINAKKKSKTLEKYDDSTSASKSSRNAMSEVDVMLTLDKTLTHEESQIVSLKVLYDYNFREIAEELNQSLGTIQAKYYKAIGKLKLYFERGK